jgi:hypothetical protein
LVRDSVRVSERVKVRVMVRDSVMVRERVKVRDSVYSLLSSSSVTSVTLIVYLCVLLRSRRTNSKCHRSQKRELIKSNFDNKDKTERGS